MYVTQGPSFDLGKGNGEYVAVAEVGVINLGCYNQTKN